MDTDDNGIDMSDLDIAEAFYCLHFRQGFAMH
jgi:hypothetical protein